MGKFNSNLVRRGMAYQKRLQKLQEERQVRVPARLMHEVNDDLVSSKAPKTEAEALRDRFHKHFGFFGEKVAPMDREALEADGVFSAKEIQLLMKQGLVLD